MLSIVVSRYPAFEPNGGPAARAGDGGGERPRACRRSAGEAPLLTRDARRAYRPLASGGWTAFMPRARTGDHGSITSTGADDWSPADNPYAIAVSQSRLWRDVVLMTIVRMRDEDDRRLGLFSSRQLDAHVLVMTLRQLLTAEQLEQLALKELGIDPVVRHALTRARENFEDALPGIKHMRDALMHFDEWLRGTGRGPQQKRIEAGEALRDVARDYASFRYESDTGTISFGPYTIQIDTAEVATVQLSDAIYAAAHEVDKAQTAHLRDRSTRALTDAGICCDAPRAEVRISPGTDLRIWLSLQADARVEEHRRLSDLDQ